MKIRAGNDGVYELMSTDCRTISVRRLAPALLMFAAGIFSASRLIAQVQPFSSTVEYRAMLDELHQQTVLPSRINVKADDSPGSIRLESDALRLEISKDHWGMALTNKQTGTTWRLAGSEPSFGGIAWTGSNGTRPAVEQSARVEHVERSLPLISPDTQTLAQDLTEHGANDEALTSNLTWRVFPASGYVQDDFTLYDGTTAEVTQDSLQTSVEVTHAPLSRRYEVILPIAGRSSTVTVGDKSLAELSGTSGMAHKMGWQINRDDGMLHVLILGNNFKLRVSKQLQ